MTAAEFLLSSSGLPSGSASDVLKSRSVTVYGFPVDLKLNTENTVELSVENQIEVKVEKSDIILNTEDDVTIIINEVKV